MHPPQDLFADDVPFEVIARVFEIMRKGKQHCFEILTKNGARLAELSPQLQWRKNIWMGVTIETANDMSRIDDLRRTGAFVKFVSAEPLRGPLPRADVSGIDSVEIGGEDGAGSRPMNPDWAREFLCGCVLAGVFCNPDELNPLFGSSIV